MACLGLLLLFSGCGEVVVSSVDGGKADGGSSSELSSLSITGPSTLVPAFTPEIRTYSVDVSLLESELQLLASTSELNATIVIDGEEFGAAATTAPLALDLGITSILIEVESETSAATTYTLNITRGEKALQQAGYGKASNSDEGDFFGVRVAVSGDTLVVAALLEDSATSGIDGNQNDNNGSRSGAVYIFHREDNSWSQEAYLKASNSDPNDIFGNSIAISGETVVVGAKGESSSSRGVGGNQTDNTAVKSGAVYVFRRTGSTWNQEAYLKASNSEAGDLFGHSVGIIRNTIVVGAIGESSNSTEVNGNQEDNTSGRSGAVYVFRRTGSVWNQEAYLKAPNTGADDLFGQSVTIVEDRLIVGAPQEDGASNGVDGDFSDNTAPDSGAAYSYVRAEGAWDYEAYLKAPNPDSGDHFGEAVALSDTELAIGAPFEDGNSTGVDGDFSGNETIDSGAVYMFSATGGSLAYDAYIKASNTGSDDNFGFVIAINRDVLAIGAFQEDSGARGIDGNDADNSSGDSGAIFVYEKRDGRWLNEAYVKASNSEAGDSFSTSIALSSNALVVGAHLEAGDSAGIDGAQESNGSPGSGAVYLFQ